MSYGNFDFLDEVQDLDFSAEIVGPMQLYDYDDTIPDDAHLDHFVTMEPITREQLFPVIIRALFCARGYIWLSRFFSELILREAITLKTVEDLIDALENHPDRIHPSEMKLFRAAHKRVQKAHSKYRPATTGNVTNAIVGYTDDVEEPRIEYIKDWLAEVANHSDCNVDMPDDLRNRFNALPISKIIVSG